MEQSEKFGFNLPSRNTDDIADINQISDNFRIIEEKIPSNEELKKEIEKATGIVDQTYNPESENAQSGIAVAEALGTIPVAPIGALKLSPASLPTVGVYVASADIILQYEERNKTVAQGVYTEEIYRTYTKGFEPDDGYISTNIKIAKGSMIIVNKAYTQVNESGYFIEVYGRILKGDGANGAYCYTQCKVPFKDVYKSDEEIYIQNTETDVLTIIVWSGKYISYDESSCIFSNIISVADLIDDHNIDEEAHADIREDISAKAEEALNQAKEYSNNTFAPAIKNSVSGETVKVSDVSGVEHKLSVKLTSDTLTDFSGVTVSRYGKNLWNYDDSLIINGDGISEVVSQQFGCSIINSPLAFSCNVDSSDLSYSTNGNLVYLGVYYSDGTTSYLTIKSTQTSDGKVQVVIPINEHAGLKNLVIAKHLRFISGTVKLSNIQIEVGATATEYTAYIEPQAVTANTDGTVEGLTSVSPNMTLITDTEGVEINLTYNMDTKAYIDNKFAELSAAILNS